MASVFENVHAATGGMGYLLEWAEPGAPDHVKDMSREEFLEAIGVNLVEAGDKIHDLPQNLPDSEGDFARGTGDAEPVELVGTILQEVGKFPKDIESLRRLRDAIASARNQE